MAERLLTRDELLAILLDLRQACFSEQMVEDAQGLLKSLELEEKYHQAQRQESANVSGMVKYIVAHSKEPLEHIRSYVEVVPEVRKAFLYANIASNHRALSLKPETFCIECDQKGSVLLPILLGSSWRKL